jgi:glucose/arabinose dehydrogenase
MKKIILLTFLLFSLCGKKSDAQISLTAFASGFNEAVDIANAGDSRLFVVERAGRIKIVDSSGIVKPGYFLDIHLEVESGYGEQGLLGLAFDPDYATTGYFYCYYTQKNTDSIRIVRFNVSATNPDSADASSEFEIMGINHNFALNHDGGGIHFRNTDGYLYFGTGDGGSGGDPGNRAQNLDTLLGKIIRIDVRSGGNPYSIPPTNPLVGLPGRDEIYNWGMRNPWRWTFDRWNGDLWIGDVGQNLYEEIDYQPVSSPGGLNYGWHCYEGNHIYSGGGCTLADAFYPVREYTHNSGGIAAIGGYRYRGAEFSDMFGKYFYSDENTSGVGIHYLLPDGAGGWADTSLGTMGRTALVCFGEDRWGEIYVSEYNNGTIYKFTGTSCSPVAFINENDTVYVCDTLAPQILRTPEGNNFHYQWYQDGNAVAGNDNDSLIINTGGSYYVIATNSGGCSATSNAVRVIYAGPPSVSFTGLDTFYCVYYSQAHLIPSPIGGTFSGTGMTGVGNSYFDPSLAGPGDFTITYSYTSPATGCSNAASSQVHVDLCSGLQNGSFMPRFNLYPNPNNGVFVLDFYRDKKTPLNIEVMDVTGRVVYYEQLHTEGGVQSLTMNLSSLSKGIYNLKVTGDDGSIFKSFVIE